MLRLLSSKSAEERGIKTIKREVVRGVPSISEGQEERGIQKIEGKVVRGVHHFLRGKKWGVSNR